MSLSNYKIPPAYLPYLLGEKTDYSSHQKSLVVVNTVAIAVVISVASLRFIVRLRIVRSAGLDDLFLALAVVFALLLSTACLIAEHFGLGKHLWNLSSNLGNLPADVGRITKALYGAYLAYATAITFTKLSIMATYTRVFPNNIIRYTVYAVGVVVIAFWVISIFTIIFTCVPVKAAWDYTIKNARCINIQDCVYVYAGVNVATDLTLCFMPLPIIWNLQVPKAQRVVTCLLITMGTFGCVCSVLRLVQLHNLTGVDVSYETATSLNWSVIEVATAISCICLSALRPLATRYLPKLFSHFTQPIDNDTTVVLGERASNMKKDYSSASKSETQSHIYVRRSYDVSELDDLPTRPGASARANGRASGSPTMTGNSFGKSSQEELVGDSIEREIKET